jgi:magnesium transporter
MASSVLRWAGADGSTKVGTLEDLASAREQATWVWVDVCDPDEQTVARLAEEFELHELAAEDALHTQRRPKLDEYPQGLFIAWLTPTHPRGDGVTTAELDAFVGMSYLITLHKGPSKAIDRVAEDCAQHIDGGPAWLLHKVIDLLADGTLEIVDKIGGELTPIEDSMLENPRQDDLRQLHRVRRQLVRLHRILAPERDLLRTLVRNSDLVSPEAYRYFQDVADHIARALDSVETYQDIAASVMDVYLSAQSNRMNEIMKQLAVVATIFMPLTLISGIYGMNVIGGMWPPAGEPVWSFWAVIGFMVALSVVMAAYFRKKNWW